MVPRAWTRVIAFSVMLLTTLITGLQELGRDCVPIKLMGTKGCVLKGPASAFIQPPGWLTWVSAAAFQQDPIPSSALSPLQPQGAFCLIMSLSCLQRIAH